MRSHETITGCRAVATLLASAAILLAGGSAAAEPRWKSDELLVRVHPGRSGAASAALEAEGATTERELDGLGISVVRVPAGQRRTAQRRLRASRLFRSVERNYLVEGNETPNDPLYPAQWALATVQAPSAWDITRGFGVTMAVVDSGVDATHPDLAGQLVGGFNAITGTTDTTDDYGHGTHMAGIAGARGYDGVGMVGLAPEARLMPVKSLNASGQGSYADVAEGIVYAVDHGARVVSLSLGGEVSSSTLSAAVTYAVSHGVVIVAAGGNSGVGMPSYPAGYADAIAVGASDGADARATFSNYGPWLDLMAPGVDILTTHRGGGYVQSSGTSPATPMVAAAAALVLAANPSLQPEQVASILATTSDDIGTPGFDSYGGWGRLDVGRAVAQAVALGQQADSAAPAVAVASPAEGATFEGAVALSATASDDVGVARVEYTLDGVVIAVATEEPFDAEWNSEGTMPGAHTVAATAYDASGNRGLSAPVPITVAGDVAACDAPGWACVPGGGGSRSDCLAEWLVRGETVISSPRAKGRVSCSDGSSCDADGAADGVCTFPVGLCFTVDDDRLVTRSGARACSADDLDQFQLLSPGFKRIAEDPVDRANAQAVLSAVASLSTGQMEGRCAAGAKGHACTEDSTCDSSSGMRDGVCSLETTSLAGIGGVETCTAPQTLRVPLRGSGTRRRKGLKSIRSATIAVPEGSRRPKDTDALTLECLPAS